MRRCYALGVLTLLVWSSAELTADDKNLVGKSERISKKSALPPSREQAKILFNQLDKNRDGRLTGDEIPERMRSRLGFIDADGDGAISKSEFSKALERIQAGRETTKSPKRPSDKSGAADGLANRKFEPKDGKRPNEKFGKAKKFAGSGGATNPNFDLIFARLDRNGDGKLGRDEAAGPLRENFDRLDTNGDGVVTKEEARAGFAANRRMRGEGTEIRTEGVSGPAKSAGKAPRELLNEQDVNADGRVDRSEAKSELAKLFDVLDLDKDGKLTLQEVEAGMKGDTKTRRLPAKK